MSISAEDSRIVGEALRAVSSGPFIPDWEFSILFGLTREEVASVAAHWPDVDLSDQDTRLAILNAFTHLVGYPIDAEEEWPRYISVSREALDGVGARVARALGES